jgi:hypothetical protein
MLKEIQNPLSRLGILSEENVRLNAQSPQERFYELNQGLRAYQKEVIEDNVLSIMYPYWFDKNGQLYTHETSRKPIHIALAQIDKRERDGLTYTGFEKLSNILFENPDRVVLWHSPPGEVDFGKDPSSPFSEIEYKTGQLYIQFFDSSKQKVVAFAIKISNEGFIEFLFENLYSNYLNYSSDRQKIETFLLNPVLIEDNITIFLEKLQRDEINNLMVYRHLDGRITTVQELAFEIKKLLGKKPDPEEDVISSLAGAFASGDISKTDVIKTYASLVRNSMLISGKNEIVLSGSCGGSTISRSSIESILGTSSPFLNVYSTDKRIVLGGKSENGSKFHCPNCHQDSEGPVGDVCPKCKITKEEAVKKGLTTC